MKPVRPLLIPLSALTMVLLAPATPALDPPHDATNSIECSSCHTPHTAPGGSITSVAGNANLCISCHLVGGQASALPFLDSDQARPAPGLPGAATPAGTSHRWDSGPAGWVEAGAGNSSPGTVASGGAFTGRFAKTYTLTITASGDAGAATFSWVATTPGGGLGSATTGSSVALDEGITVTFTDGAASPSFAVGDVWWIYVRTDLGLPADPEMAARLEDGRATCSTCHDQHSQAEAPFDPTAPPFGGPGTGDGRHFQRVANDLGQMCVDCHGARDVVLSAGGSHPVGVPIPGTGDYRPPAALPLDAGGGVACLSCHQPHYAPTNDGTLLRLANQVALCSDCHTLAGAGASHLDSGTGVLWPGGQYGSIFPQVTDSSKTGACSNCHQPHGWPDDGMPANDYPQLLVERHLQTAATTDTDEGEDLCYTCHDGAPAANILAEFAKGSAPAAVTDPIFRHPVRDSEQVTGRSVECNDCHNPHQATSANKVAGVSGIEFNASTVASATAEYQVCFKCHGDTYNTSRNHTTNKRTDFQPDRSAYHPIGNRGRNRSTSMVNNLVSPWTIESTMTCTACHTSEQGSGPQGPHGSTEELILKAAYWSDRPGPSGSWNGAKPNYALCFECHSSGPFDNENNIQTNFNDGGDNFHWYHLSSVGEERIVCAECHYNIHGNENETHTNWRIDGTTFTSPPTSWKTRLVSFAPEITGCCGFADPTWDLVTGNRRRTCYISCHGENHGNGKDYQPASGRDNDNLALPTGG